MERSTETTTPSSYASSSTYGYGYVSWNGATEVTGWNIYAGGTKDRLKYLGRVGFEGFETRFEIPCWAEWVKVGAVEDGEEVECSEVVVVV